MHDIETPENVSQAYPNRCGYNQLIYAKYPLTA